MITGTGFVGVSAVSFGGTKASSFTVNSSTQITAVSSAHAAGQGRVAVTTSSGTSAENVLFTFIPRPSVTQVNPSSGPTVDGTNVILTGADLTFTGAVFFGARPAAFTVLSGTQVAAVAPAGTGTVVVTATTRGGTSVSGAAYTYVGAPVI
jgi:hypothetical protein